MPGSRILQCFFSIHQVHSTIEMDSHISSVLIRICHIMDGFRDIYGDAAERIYDILESFEIYHRIIMYREPHYLFQLVLQSPGSGIELELPSDGMRKQRIDPAYDVRLFVVHIEISGHGKHGHCS